MEHSISKHQYNVLVVAPYQGMKYILEQESKSFPELSLHIVIGNLETGVQLAESNFHNSYDLILSRGGTATLLKTRVQIPVIEIPTSFFDILRAIRLSEGIQGKKAVVGYSGITENARMLNQLMDLGLDIYTLNDSADLANIMKKLAADSYSTVLCDVVSSDEAIKVGLNAILITSGTESIREALFHAISTIESRENLMNENHLLRHLLNEHTGSTAVFDSNGTLYFRTDSNQEDSSVIDTLKTLIPDVLSGDTGNFWKSINGNLYTIKSSVINSDKNRIVFYYSRAKSTNASNQIGITYQTKSDSERIYMDGIFRITGDINDLKPQIKTVYELKRPVLIVGENGTGRSQVASYISINSSEYHHSLITIDLSTINDKSASYLLNNQKSPLYYNGNTLLFCNLDLANPEYLHNLIFSLNHMEVCRNNLVIFTASPVVHNSHNFRTVLKDNLQCIEILLRPLRESKEKIPALTNLYITQLSSKSTVDILRVERDALLSLQNYDWPGNYSQFKRMISELAAESEDHIIHNNQVNELLSKETNYGPVGHFDNKPAIRIDQNLNDSIRQIVKLALDENNGNQTAAAKQLGIGRTTLWRYLKD
jgi:transcriptional regulator with PAS, ATPase and Fis domain